MTEETLKRMLIDNIGIREFAEEMGTEIGDIICDNISCQRCFFSGEADCEKKLRKYCRKMFAGSGRSKHPNTRMTMYDMTDKSITCPKCGYEYCWDDTPTNIHREIKFCLHCGIVFAGYANRRGREVS